MERKYTQNPWARYADDGVAHCRTKEEATRLLDKLNSRFEKCGLELHPDKTRIVYCKDDDRRQNYPETKFDFLGYTFRPRRSKNRYGKFFINFTPAVSNKSISRGSGRSITLKPTDKAIARLREKMREVISRERLYRGIKGIIEEINPILRGWKNYFKLTNIIRIFWDLNFYVTGRFYRVGRKTSQRYSKAFKPGVYITLRKMGLYCLINGAPVKALR
ncbi:MAG: group II intron maturase-specific domain-containing protein [Desulfotomaculaceae bacterium]|nr:group II intron maturase-specific domain-containing protein [Desulfotomaculaceae bacterium]